MTPLGRARAQVGELLRQALPDVVVHDTVPAVPTTPCVWVAPAYDWLARTRLGCVQVRLDVVCAVGQSAGMPVAQLRSEDLVWTVWQALSAAGLDMDPGRGPESRTVGDQELLIAVIPVEVQVDA